ncbi:ABC transporter ATP-binding protein [Nannocystis sp. ILAH1]|uniref:ABC transporter ATP-binding protein n=1 Tax=unclassified Nannocystis TaxID=2627009 RepID=UPI00226DCC8A|nr:MULTISPECIES: ABC transporter ATP-binding protein [unclassified Nannocystis]MCY0992908.1 ABC transporter ATP-binding protein [Nannocystis sp. ILAH1]MCY1066254.1 ABC transporter ATP-binding protein [Nannocystis sp. RBIL2]
MQRVVCVDVNHSYDGVRDAVRDLRLEIRAGEVLALIGPNGAGKSTTLRILATLQKPDRGTVLWDGRDAWDDRYAIRQKIGFLGDGTALYPGMTAAGYLTFFADCYGQDDKAAKERVDELLQVFDLASKANARISDMSKGMRQRLAIARTLVHRPELLLLDEPADGLDPLARRQLREVLRQVAGEGVGIVISSHILRELDGFCDAVAVIQQGKLEVHGPVDEVINRYEVGRRLHEVQVTRGLVQAIEILRKHEGLIEAVLPLHKGEPQPDPEKDERGLLRVRIHGSEERAAHLLKELVLADVEVISLSKVRSDLEDVYSSLGRDKVS